MMLKEYREAMGMGQRALGKLSGVSVAMISRIESGDRAPSPAIIHELVTAMGLPPEDRAEVYYEYAIIPLHDDGAMTAICDCIQREFGGE